MAVSLSGYPMQTDNKILNATAELGGDFAYNLDINSGKPLGVGEILISLMAIEVRSFCYRLESCNN
jgi:hypothetical protein